MRRNRRDKSSKRDLVPFEKSKRVIHLDKRGKGIGNSGVRRVLSSILGMLGVLCLSYCVGVSLVGYGTYFFLIWGVIGFVLLVLARILYSSVWSDKIPKWVRGMLVSLTCVGLVVFCTVEGLICAQFFAVPPSGADYCVVLGAQWKSNGPSDVLRRRLDAAVEYLMENPETKVIVTGGQGQNEVLAEGVGMAGYLSDAGIENSRILIEDKATNTYENLVFSAEYLDETKDTVVLVTNNFHVFRALKIAEKQGYERVSGLAADSVEGLLPNNLLREFFGVIKDFIMGNL